MVNFVVLLRRAMLVECQMADKKPDRPVIGRGIVKEGNMHTISKK